MSFRRECEILVYDGTNDFPNSSAINSSSLDSGSNGSFMFFSRSQSIIP